MPNESESCGDGENNGEHVLNKLESKIWIKTGVKQIKIFLPGVASKRPGVASKRP